MEKRPVTVVAKGSTLEFNPYYLSILQKSNNNIDVSFSSYLKRLEEDEEEDAELSIFDARKYFSEGTTDPTQGQKDPNNPPRLSSVSSATVSSYSRSNFQAPRTASSEASWNSQTGLLSSLRNTNGGSIGERRETKNKRDANRGSLSGSKWIFRRKSACPCTSKKSVQVQENANANVSSPASEFKSKNSSPGPLVHVNNINSISLCQNNPSRPVTDIVHQIKSLEPIRLTIPPNPVVQERIFQRRTNDSSRTVNGGFSFPILKPQSSETTIKPLVNPASSKDEEVASDASSDLFELESFSTQTNSQVRAAIFRDSLDKTLTETNTEYCYEPSEASVTWSVTTAEPVTSVGISSFSAAPQPPPPPGFGKRRSSGGNVFLSCRCEKAVMISDGHRPLPPKSVSVPRPVRESILHNNESPKLRIINQSSIVMYK